jgi:ketosteroid isomerase-like protein
MSDERRLIRAGGLALLVTIGASGCAPHATVRRQDIAALEQQLAEIERFTTPDAVRYLGYFVDDLTLLPPDRPAIAGKAAALEFYRSAFAGVPSFTLEYSDPVIDLAGDLAVRRYDGVGRLNAADGREAVVRRVKYLDVLRRQPDGTWKITVHSWGPNEPAAP